MSIKIKEPLNPLCCSNNRPKEKKERKIMLSKDI